MNLWVDLFDDAEPDIRHFRSITGDFHCSGLADALPERNPAHDPARSGCVRV